MKRSISHPGDEAMSPLFGAFKVRVDPWEVDYGSETPLAPLDDQLDQDVALDVELPAER